jgi:hypothetical protein
MSTDEFWNLIDHVHSLSPDDMPAKCKNLETLLRARPLHDLVNFNRHFGRFYFNAYTWDLWAAAFIIGDGCSDDSFMDFRSTLVSMGKTIYTNALADPETLADTNIHPDWAHYEGYQYVASKLWRESHGEIKDFPPDPNEPDDQQKHPREPAGERFVEWELSKKFPRLTAKFDYKDSSWFYLRDLQQKEEQKQKAAENLGDLLLRAQLIPRNGLIPPYRLLRPALQTGDARRLTGTAVTWEPFDLDEGVYWAAVVHLENLPPEKLALYPHLKTTNLRQDLKTNAPTFTHWFNSNV